MTDWRHHRTDRLWLDIAAPGRAALAAAADPDPGRPVVAFLLEHNVASRRTAERLGPTPVWRGPDAGDPDPDAVRLVFADRPLDPSLSAKVTTHA